MRSTSGILALTSETDPTEHIALNRLKPRTTYQMLHFLPLFSPPLPSPDEDPPEFVKMAAAADQNGGGKQPQVRKKCQFIPLSRDVKKKPEKKKPGRVSNIWFFPRALFRTQFTHDESQERTKLFLTASSRRLLLLLRKKKIDYSQEESRSSPSELSSCPEIRSKLIKMM